METEKVGDDKSFHGTNERLPEAQENVFSANGNSAAVEDKLPNEEFCTSRITNSKSLENPNVKAVLEQLSNSRHGSVSTDPHSPSPTEDLNEDEKQDHDPFVVNPKPLLQQITAVVRPLPSKPVHVVCGKNRTRFSPPMVQFMEKHYQENKYPKADEYKVMASVLGLDWNKIKVWFQNRRSKERKENGGVIRSTEKEPERKRRKLNDGTLSFPIMQNSLTEPKNFECQKPPVLPNPMQIPLSGGFGQKNSNFPLKVQDEVNHLTDQLCTSQINPSHLTSAFPANMNNHSQSMWQPFGGAGMNDKELQQGLKAHMKPMSAGVPPTGVLLPPVLQPMLLGMPSVYMMPPVTPIDLTKKPSDINSPYYHPHFSSYRMENQYRPRYTVPNKAGVLGNRCSNQQSPHNFGQQVVIPQQKKDMAYNSVLPNLATGNNVSKPTKLDIPPSNKSLDYQQFPGATPLQKLVAYYDSVNRGVLKPQVKPIPAEYNLGKGDFRPYSVSSVSSQQVPIPSSGYLTSYPSATQYDKLYSHPQNSTSYTMAYPLYSNSENNLCSSFLLSNGSSASSTITLSDIAKNKENLDILKTNNTCSYNSNVAMCSETPQNSISSYDPKVHRSTSLTPNQMYLQVTANTTSDNQVDYSLTESVELQMEGKPLSMLQNPVPSVLPQTACSTAAKEYVTLEDNLTSSLKYYNHTSPDPRDSGIGASVNHYSDYFSVPKPGASSNLTEYVVKEDNTKLQSPTTDFYDINSAMSQFSPIWTQNSSSPSDSPPLCTSTPVKAVIESVAAVATDELSSITKLGEKFKNHSPQSPGNVLPTAKVSTSFCFDPQCVSGYTGVELNPAASQPNSYHGLSPVADSSLVLHEGNLCDMNNNTSSSNDFEKDYVQL